MGSIILFIKLPSPVLLPPIVYIALRFVTERDASRDAANGAVKILPEALGNRTDLPIVHDSFSDCRFRRWLKNALIPRVFHPFFFLPVVHASGRRRPEMFLSRARRKSRRMEFSNRTPRSRRKRRNCVITTPSPYSCDSYENGEVSPFLFPAPYFRKVAQES